MKVGDYVRTKDGLIGKLFGYNAYDENKIAIHTKTNENGCKITPVIDTNRIIKSSPNLIDLIEVGDYVNGSKVLDIAQAPKKAIYTEQENGGALLPIVNNRIESVLTKEMFESMEYKVGE